MAKGRHLKRLKSEKAKVKLKAKNKQLPKGLNVTDTSFKAKKILIRGQLQQRDETEILSIRKLNINDLLKRLKHHNSGERGKALKQLKEILLQYSPKTLHSQLSALLHGIVALSLDKEKGIRRDSFSALNSILGPISKEQLTPFHDILISYLRCAMTDINSHVKEDSLLFLDVLAQNCGGMLVKNSHKILSNLLGLICTLHNEVRHGRQLKVTLNSRSTSVKWRINVLKRLADIFTSIINYKKLHSSSHPSALAATTEQKKYSKYVPIYGRQTRYSEIDIEKDLNSVANSAEGPLPTEEFEAHIKSLMPLMFDIWLEVCPEEKVEDYTEITITSEAASLLKNIVEITQSIIEYIDTLNRDDCNAARIKHWFKDTFHNMYMKNFLTRFPYGKVKQLNEIRKRQDSSPLKYTEECVEQNLGLCQIHVWFTSVIGQKKQFPKSTRDHCVSILKYLNDIVEHIDSSVMPQLNKLLRSLFLKASPIWYANSVSLSDTLRLIIEVSCREPRKELQSHLFLIIGDILLECNLYELHKEKALKHFVATLPSLLLGPSVDDVTIRMINQIILRFKHWVRKQLAENHEAIIENAKKIKITGSHDDKQSRLMICNLFYCIDSQIYY